MSNNKAVKKDGNGEVVATYIRESKFNKKSLFESALRFDLKNTIIENWKWVEGDKTFSDSMSKKFDDAISQIGETGGESDVEGDGAENTELEEEWKNFPCVYNNPNKKAYKRKDGTTSFLINNVHFFNNGRCMDTKTKEKRNYKCVDGKIVFFDKKQEKETKPKQSESYAEVKKLLAKEGKDFLVGDFAETFPKIYKEMETEVDKDDSFEDFADDLEWVGVEEFTAVYKTLSKYDKEGVIPAFLKVYEKVHDQSLIDDVDSEDADRKEEEDIKKRIMSILEKYNDSWWDKLSNWFKNL